MVPKRRERGGDVARTMRGNPGAVERYVTSRRGLSGTSGRPAAPVRYWRQRRRFCDRDSEAPAHPALRPERPRRSQEAKRTGGGSAEARGRRGTGESLGEEFGRYLPCPPRKGRASKLRTRNPQERSWSVRFERIGAVSGRAKAKQTVEGVGIPEDGRCRRYGNLAAGKTGRLRRQTLQGKELQERCIGSARAGTVSSREASRRQATGVRSPSASKTEGDTWWKQTRRAPPETAKVERGGWRLPPSSDPPSAAPQRTGPSFEEADVRSAATRS